MADGHTLIETPLFPKNGQIKSIKRYDALIGIGSNIKNPMQKIKKLYFFLQKDPYIDICFTSHILKNPAFGYTTQPDFFNAAAAVKTNLTPLPLLRRLLWIEKRFGRKRSFKNAPRTLDLDIIFFENLIMYNKKLILPHPEYKNRASVLLPMTYKRSKLKWKK